MAHQTFSNIKLPFALRNGELIHVSEVRRGLNEGVCCPQCFEPVVARKGERVRHHFAHHHPTGSCSFESLIHSVGKHLMVRKIQDALATGKHIRLSWRCAHCRETHEGNLLRKAASVALEYALEGCRPDVVLFDDLRKPVAIIEIIVSHAPERNVRDYCSGRKIGLLEYPIQTESDLDRLRLDDALHMASGENACTRKKCTQCQKPLSWLKIHVNDGRCTCGRRLKIAYGSIEGEPISGPQRFRSEHIRLAEEHGAHFEKRFSKNTRGYHLTNQCPKCKTFYPPHLLHDFAYFDPKNVIATEEVCTGCGPRR